MDSIFEPALVYIQSNVHYAPWLIFGLMCLAGLNIPVSEDLMIIVSATLAKEHQLYSIQLFIAILSGAYVSDLICYGFLGRYLGNKAIKIKLINKLESKKSMRIMAKFYEKYGVIALFIGRFIPFGVRNAIFLTAGLSKMNAIKFALVDLISCVLSVSIYFYLYYQYGERIMHSISKGNTIIFIIFIAIVIAICMKLYKKRKTI